jgi:hypothetical protein
MLISIAIRSRTAAVGVGFLLNSTSRVINCSCVARWRFWFFCCWVKVLFRGGRRGAEPCVGVKAVGVEGEGVEAGCTSSSACMVEDGCECRPGLGDVEWRPVNGGSGQAIASVYQSS